MTIASLIVDVAANSAKLTTDVQKIHGQLNNVSSAASRVGTMLAGAFTLTAIAGAANQVLNYAGKISDLAAQTGMSTKAIQEMQHAAKMTGASLENFTNAAFKLGTNLAGGGNSVQGAVEKLGLSYSQLKAMSPESQFNTIATALSHVQNAQDRNKLAVELFGKAAKDIIPAIAQGYDSLAKSASIAGDAQLQALDMAGDALDSFMESVMSLGVQLAGGLDIAVREGMRVFEEWTGIVASLKAGFEAWGTALEFVGLKAQKMPEIMNATRVAASNLPQPLQAVNISVEEQERRMRALELQHRSTTTSTRNLSVAQDEVDENIQRLTSSFTAQIDAFRRQNTIQNTVHDSFRLMRVEFKDTIPVLQNLTTNGFEPFKATLEQNKSAVSGWAQHSKEIFGGVPNAIMSAIQGGGSIIGAAGASIGMGLMDKFSKHFGPAIKDALPFGIGNAVVALLPTLGALFGPVAEKLAGFFRSIFGGPSAEEMRGRQAVADFETQLHGLLSATQKAEAGNESWKMTVIAIRDAYLAAGLSEGMALEAAERLWASSKKGAAETQAAIAAINAVLNGATVAAVNLDHALDQATQDRFLRIGFNVDEFPQINGPGFATGSGGIRDYGRGTPVVLHGRERVQTEAQMKEEQGGNLSGLITEIRALRNDLPRALKLAVADAMVGV